MYTAVIVLQTLLSHVYVDVLDVEVQFSVRLMSDPQHQQILLLIARDCQLVIRIHMYQNRELNNHDHAIVPNYNTMSCTSQLSQVPFSHTTSTVLVSCLEFAW